MGYLLLCFSAFLLSLNFAATKFYQSRYGNTLQTGLIFNVLSGLITAVVFFPFIEVGNLAGWFSIGMVVLQTVFIVSYTLIGFQLMEKGTVALYTMALMTGGMLVPYFYGMAFLNESVYWVNLLGVMVIVIAMVLMNAGEEKLNKRNVFLLACVFLINGGTSIVTKVHQTSELATFGTLEYIWFSGVARAGLSAAILPFLKEQNRERREENGLLKSAFLFVVPILASVALDKLSLGLQLVGAKTTPATMMFPIISGGTVAFTAMVSFALFREQLSKKSIVALVICLIGTLLFV